jgi:hypothetical protein
LKDLAPRTVESYRYNFDHYLASLQHISVALLIIQAATFAAATRGATTSLYSDFTAGRPTTTKYNVYLQESRFKSITQTQRFLENQAAVYNLFHLH